MSGHDGRSGSNSIALLTEVGEPQQVSTLLYCLGEEADSVLDSTEDDRKRYANKVRKCDTKIRN